MPKDYLPAHVDPLRLAEHATTLDGLFQLKNMERLAQSLHASEGDTDVQLKFGIEQGGVRYLKGNLSASLTLQCQRCMESFSHHVQGEFAYGLVNTEAKAKQLSRRYDPVFVADDSLNIQDLIEDELILNLPIVPMHCSADCKVHLPIVVAEDPGASADDNNPFKVIELLKVKNRSE
jgi:uncharacterized protein